MSGTSAYEALRTPCYCYNLGLLGRTLDVLCGCLGEHPDFNVHYAVKANANPRILREISSRGLGADCVSGNEVLRAIECGFPAEKIVYAGVGKSDREIAAALDNDIFCFNCESVEEMQVIDQMARSRGMRARIAIRVNPNVDAHTHAYITTGLEENKFGIYFTQLPQVVEVAQGLRNIDLIGLHFHIGSQITDMYVFKSLAMKINDIQEAFADRGILFQNINVGGGLGIEYGSPYSEPIANFKDWFAVFDKYLLRRPEQRVHFEPGRSVVAHCGDLLSRVLFVKEGGKRFIVLDAGMSDLIRPALYHSYHNIENLSAPKDGKVLKYDVVGPICESSDCFGKDVPLPETHRGDLFKLHTTGAYGEVMASRYNLRDLPKVYFM